MRRSKPIKEISKILQIAFKCATAKDLAANYGAIIAEACNGAEEFVRCWPHLLEEVEAVNRYARRGEWWSCVYDGWPKRLLQAAQKDRMLFLIGGTCVTPVEDNVPAVDRVEMMKEYEYARLKKTRKNFVDVNAG